MKLRVTLEVMMKTVVRMEGSNWLSVLTRTCQVATILLVYFGSVITINIYVAAKSH